MLFPLLLSLLSLPLLADTVRIQSVSEDFIKLEDGRVAYTKDTSFFYPDQIVDLELNADHDIVSAIPALLSPVPIPPTMPTTTGNTFKPTVVKSYAVATNLLLTFNPNAIEGAQCYDRAHVWAYEASKKQKTELGKAWLFFADHYIKEYKFKWWFHVAPMATVMMKGEIAERIMDREFAKFPMQFKIWTDKFMVNKVECKEIRSYSEYSKHPGENDCYMLKSTPYFWQPKDLEEAEKSGKEKQDYIPWEVAYAFRYGFGQLISYGPVNQ